MQERTCNKTHQQRMKNETRDGHGVNTLGGAGDFTEYEKNRDTAKHFTHKRKKSTKAGNNVNPGTPEAGN